MLQDSAHIQEFEAEWKNRKARRSGKPEVVPIYTMDDAINVMQYFVPCPYGGQIEVADGITIKFTDIGHLLGSSSIEVWLREAAVITKDNVTMQIDTVVYFQITDPKLYSYGVENPIMAIENLTATTLRNVIGDLELDETLTSRETINTQMRATLDVATDPWGIKVNRVELKNIIPPAAIQDAMEKQMKAERERREAILIAEGEKKSAILRAEGQKESMVLQAEGDKEAAILRAEAKKEATIREAEGQAEAIRAIQKANAQGIESIKAAKADNAVIQLKSLEAFAKAADGKATKIIIPSEIQGMAGLVKSITEVAKDNEKNIADLIEEQVQDTVKEQ